MQQRGDVMKIRGQVKRQLPKCLARGIKAEEVLHPRWVWPGLNKKDRAQLATILRAKTPWARQMIEEARNGKDVNSSD
jgi:hypothetical protein